MKPAQELTMTRKQDSDCTLSNPDARRDFLKRTLAGSAAVAGTVVTGTALAAGDEACIELPPDNAQTFQTTCQYCMVQCGYVVKVWERGSGRTPSGSYAAPLSGDWISPSMVVPAETGGKKVYIAVTPDKNCVVNQGDHSVRGGTNALALFSKNLPSAKTRLQHPQIRTAKGKPLQRVSWDSAIAFTAERLDKLRREHGPDALGLVWGDWLWSLPTHAILKLWFEGIGSSSYAGNGWAFDEESSGVSHALGSGTRSFTEEDFEKTGLLFTAGTNIWANGTVWYNRFHLKNPDAKQIVVDPQRTAMARHAEERGGLHLKLLPGTDYILAAGLVQEILRRDAWDKEFVSQWVTGFDVVQRVAMAERFSLPNVARATTVPEAQLKAAADLLIAHKGRTMVLHEKGIQHQMAAFENQFGYTTIGVLLGNLGKPGACASRAGGHPGGTWSWPSEPASRKDNDDIMKGLREGKVKSIWAFGSNVYKQLPDLERHRPLIAKTFFIVEDRIATEMNRDADVVLPAATWGEIDGVLTSVTRRVRMQQKFMDAPGEAKPDWWIVAQVAKKMGFKGFDWKNEAELWDEIRGKAGDIKEVSWDMLRQAGTNGVRWPYVNGKAPERLYGEDMEQVLGKRFFTKDNKVHLQEFELLGKLDHDRFEWGEVDGQYPLMAFDFRLDELWNTGYTYWDKPTVSARTPDAFLLIHPEDAKPRGIVEGQWVKLRSRQGECHAKARVTDGVAKGSVGMPALFPKKGQEFNHVTRAAISPINGNFDTMVAVQVARA
jgi:arsenite oxidase large subunit